MCDHWSKPKPTKAELIAKIAKPFVSAKHISCATLRIKYEDGSEAISYRQTDVVTWLPNGLIVFNSGGFRTLTTKSRIMDHTSFNLYSGKGHWYIYKRRGGESPYSPSSDRKVYYFYDGITFDGAGNLVSEERKPDTKRINKIKKQIAGFIALVDAGVPPPESGDCWFCSLTSKGETLGDVWKDTDHLVSHIEDGYLHGSLVLNALNERGYDLNQLRYVWNNAYWVKRALRRYLFKRLLPEMACR